MKKIISIFLFMFLPLAAFAADRMSYDRVASSNGAYNNYVQDVVGNKKDETNGNSVISAVKRIQANVRSLSAGSSAVGDATYTVTTNTRAKLDAARVVIDADVIVNTNIRSLVTANGIVGTNTRSISTANGVVVTNIRSRQNAATLNATNNVISADVIGNRRDGHGTTTIAGRVKMLAEHVHSSNGVYPFLATGKTATNGNAAWTFTNYSVMVETNVIGKDFDIHGLYIEFMANNDTYLLQFYVGQAFEPIGAIKFVKTAVSEPVGFMEFMTPMISANRPIYMRCATLGGGANDLVRLSIQYHTY